MKPLQNPDRIHLDAAVGWFELGNLVESSDELENITPLLREHPDVLQVRCKIYIPARKREYAAEITNTLCTLVRTKSFQTAGKCNREFSALTFSAVPIRIVQLQNPQIASLKDS